MGRRRWADRAQSLLAADIAAGAASLTVTTGEGARFASPGANQVGVLVIGTGPKANPTAVEHVTYTSRAGDTFSGLARGQEGTTAAAWTVAGATWVMAVLTAESINAAVDEDGVQTITGQKTFAADTLRTSLLTLLPTNFGPASATTRPTGQGAAGLGVFEVGPGGSETRLLPFYNAESPLLGADEMPMIMAPHLFSHEYFEIVAQASGTTAPVVGGKATLTASGTLSAIAFASGSRRGERPRTQYASAVAANSTCGVFASNAQVPLMRRDRANARGGFITRFVFGLEALTTAAQLRLFIGLSSQTANTCAAEPSAATGDYIGVGCDAADANLTILTRNNVTTTKGATTTTEPKTQNTLYDLWIADVDDVTLGGIWVRLVAYRTGYSGTVLHDGIITTTLPRAGIPLRPHITGGTLGASQAANLSLAYAYGVYPGL